jgi:spermidine synthase
MNRALWLAFITGFIAANAQILIIREFLATFLGNELTIGLIFGVWFLGISLGACLAGQGGTRTKIQARRLLVGTQIGQIVLLPAALVSIRFSHKLWGIPYGQWPALSQMLGAALSGILPFSFMIGFLFPILCQSLAEDSPANRATPIAAIYLSESLGGLIGGLICSCVLVRLFSAMNVLWWLLALLFMSMSSFIPLSRLKSCALLGAFLIFFAGGARLHLADRLEDWLAQTQWPQMAPGSELIQTRQTPYQYLALARQAEQYNLYGNGIYLTSFPNDYENALAANFFMTIHSAPRRILLIGEASFGLLRPMLDYPLEQIDYVELDPGIEALCAPYLAEADRQALHDRRVRRGYGDGRFFVKNHDDGPGYDLIIADVGEPASALNNRYFTQNFYEECRLRLNPAGIFITKIRSAANYAGPDLSGYIGSVYGTLRSVFPQVLVTPGTTCFFIAANAKAGLTLNPELLAQRYTKTGIRSDYFSPYHYQLLIPSAMTTDINARLAREPRGPSNTDERPRTYQLNLKLWRIFSGSDRPASWLLGPVRPGYAWLLGLLVLGLMLSFLGQAPPPRRQARAGFLAILITGLIGMGLEIVLMFLYQNCFGYLYTGIGLVIGLFMAGLSLGSLAGIELVKRWTRLSAAAILWASESLLTLFILLLLPMIRILPHRVGLNPMALEALIYLAIFLAGSFTGLIFPLSSQMVSPAGQTIGKSASWLNSLDHLGALLGSLLTGIFLIPGLGLSGTLLLFAALTGSFLLAFGFMLLRAKKIQPD